MAIRNAAKAIVVDGGKILLDQCESRHGVYYTFPGGGQRDFETIEEAVARECMEETGYAVVPERFAGIFEEISDNETARERYPDYAHKIHHYFICRLADEKRGEAVEPDAGQVASVWIELDALDTISIVPKVVGERLFEMIEGDAPVYFGAVHLP